MTREELKEQIDELMQQYANEEIDGPGLSAGSRLGRRRSCRKKDSSDTDRKIKRNRPGRSLLRGGFVFIQLF